MSGKLPKPFVDYPREMAPKKSSVNELVVWVSLFSVIGLPALMIIASVLLSPRRAEENGAVIGFAAFLVVATLAHFIVKNARRVL